MTVVIAGVSYECTKAVKGPNFVHLYQGDLVVLSCLEITDFSVYVLIDGEWSDPDPDLDVIADSAELSGGSIVITSKKIIGTGTLLKFKAPCDCTAVTGGLVIDGKTYAVVDALAGVVTGKGGAWSTGAMVSVLIDKANLRAFIQNIRAATTLTITGTVYTTMWATDSTSGYLTLDVVANGILATDNPVVDIVLGSDADANALYEEFWAGVKRVTAEKDNYLRIYAEAGASVQCTIQAKVVR